MSDKDLSRPHAWPDYQRYMASWGYRVEVDGHVTSKHWALGVIMEVYIETH